MRLRKPTETTRIPHITESSRIISTATKLDQHRIMFQAVHFIIGKLILAN
jgi:hypothetical protein